EARKARTVMVEVIVLIRRKEDHLSTHQIEHRSDEGNRFQQFAGRGQYTTEAPCRGVRGFRRPGPYAAVDRVQRTVALTVDKDGKRSASLDEPLDRLERGARVRRVMEDADRVREIEDFEPERQLEEIGLP